MTTEKYKCIANPISQNCYVKYDKEYDVHMVKPYPFFIDDKGNSITISISELNRCFQKVEPTTQPMKYKVTITSADHTGFEGEEIYEDVSQNDFFSLLGQNRNKKVSIEPMPEKKKVTVWFYIHEIDSTKTICSALNFEFIENHRNQMVKAEIKCSEIKSMQLEI